MSSFRFAHAADIHLDSPLRGLERYEDAPVTTIRAATRTALRNLVDLCLEREVSFLILAGDLYDGDWKSYKTGRFFSAQMRRLKEAGIRVFSVRGNHDAASQMTKYLPLPDNVVDFSTRKPQTEVLDELGVAIHGQGYAVRAVTENLADKYPPAIPGFFNLGILHTSLDGREGHERYAPCKLGDLEARGYDYWALGHVHQWEVVSRDPHVVFSGNLQGRHARETGPKGCAIVEVAHGRALSVTREELDVVRWLHLRIDLTGVQSEEGLRERLESSLAAELAEAGGRVLALRLTLAGTTPLQARFLENEHESDQWIRELVRDLQDDIWVEKIIFGARLPRDIKALRTLDAPLGRVLRTIQRLRQSDEPLGVYIPDLPKLKKSLRRVGGELLGSDTRELLGGLLPEVEQLLVYILTDEGGGS